jgi:hypothetical protein
MTIFLFFAKLLLVLKWGLLFEKGRGLATAGHPSSTGSDSNLTPASLVGVRVTLLMAVYSQSVRFGAKPLGVHSEGCFFCH